MKIKEDKKKRQKIYNQLWKEDKWTELRRFLFKWLKEDPASHWLLAQIAETYYLQGKHKEALRYAEKAFKISPRCPVVLWEYSESLDEAGKHEEAASLYKSVIRKGVRRIAFGKCGEGILKARTLVNDCRYKLGITFADKGEFQMAEKYIKEYIVNRNPNCTSCFNLREVKKDLAQIQQGKKPR